MKPGLPAKDSALSPPQGAAVHLQLLVTLDPWYRGLLRNVCDLFSAEAPPAPWSSASAPWGQDVFVGSGLPWRRFAESAILHGVLVLGLWVVARLGPQRPYWKAPVAFSSTDVIRYELVDYLPALDSGGQSSAEAEKGAPAHAAQPITSVPADSESRRQTIVSPPKLELNQDTPLPNMVVWAEARIPAAATAVELSDVRVPGLPASVVAPPPEVVRGQIESPPVLSQAVIAPAPDILATMRRNDAPTPQPAIVGPPPGIEVASLDQWQGATIGPARVVSPAPQLPVDEQHALKIMARTSLSNSAVSVVPPSPQEESTTIPTERGRLIALNVHPAPPSALIEVPSGNRRGAFAASPAGEADATSTPEIPASRARTTVPPTKAPGSATDQRIPGVPPGLFVGPSSRTELGAKPNLEVERADPAKGSLDAEFIAKASAPRVAAAQISADQQSELERQVFGGRRSYSMTLNLPNLNSAGGSWVMHFSELQEGEKGDLVAPQALRAVAPGYPLELMRENVAGTVTLSAVISSDGNVGEVTVLSGSNDRLNEYARNALLGWRFMPALRNGKPVALLAVVRIPFKPRVKTSF